MREFAITRTFSADYLRKRGVSVPEEMISYSYNPGLWGVSVSGKETLTSDGLLPDEAWYRQPDSKATGATLTLSFTRGELSYLNYNDEHVTEPIAIIRRLTEIGSALGIGRHYHVGTSVPGKKGRVAYGSPAADIIYEAHKVLEKVVLSQAQINGKRSVADVFGQLVPTIAESRVIIRPGDETDSPGDRDRLDH